MNIFDAAECNDFEKVKFLVENNPNATVSVNDAGQTIAHIAARNGNLDMLKYVANKDPSIVTRKDEDGYNVLQVAVEEGALETVKYLVEKHNTNILEFHRPESGNTGTAVHRAAAFGHLNILKYFIEERLVDVNAPLPSTAQRQQPLLFLAVKYQRRDIIEYLIDERKADVKVLDWAKENILFVAVRKNDLAFIKYLLDVKKIGFDVNWGNWQRKTVVHIAAFCNRIDILKYFVGEKRALINIPEGEKTPLHWAAAKNHYEICQYLIERGANVNQGDGDGGSSLLCATSVKMCKFLIERGANINHKNKRGDIFVHVAAFKNRMEILKFLVEEKHMPVNVVNNHKVTPLHYAAAANHYEACEYLVRHRANLLAKDEFGERPVQEASDDHVIEFLKKAAGPRWRNRRSLDFRKPCELRPFALNRFRSFFLIFQLLLPHLGRSVPGLQYETILSNNGTNLLTVDALSHGNTY